jgi:hypothetical protein
LDTFSQRAFNFLCQRPLSAFKSATTAAAAASAAATATAASASATTRTTAITATTTATALALGHHVDAGACGIRLALTATLGFMAKGIDPTLGA